jgi:hypothetical protein
MKAWVRYFSIILVLALSILACSTEMQGTPTPASGDVLFADNFSNPNSGWDRIQDSGGSIDYLNGKYRMMVNTADTDVWANPGKKFGDVSVQVNAAKVGGTDNNDYGVICRYQDSDHFYFFVISSDGYYGIGKAKDCQFIMVKGEDMLHKEDILKGGETNAIQADCVGSTLSLSINGKVIDTQKDTDYTAGDVGLLAGTFAEAGVEVEFDDFIVKMP